MKQKRLISITVFIELLIIFYLGILICFKKYNIFTDPIIEVISKKSLINNFNSKLEFFYELKPKVNTIINSITSHKALYTINYDSLNERFDYSISKLKNTFRIVTLGDSFTFGLYVDTKNNWVEKLEDLLNNQLKCKNINKFEVINLGVPGYDIQYSVERYRLRGKKYNPDLILWFLKDDDFEEINETIGSYLSKNVENSKDLSFLIKVGSFYTDFFVAVKKIYQKLGQNNLLKKQVEFLQEFTHYYHNSLLLFTFPFTKKSYIITMKNYVSSIQQGYFFDGLTNIHDYPEMLIADDGHLNKKGNETIAQDLFNYLTKNKLIPCN